MRGIRAGGVECTANELSSWAQGGVALYIPRSKRADIPGPGVRGASYLFVPGWGTLIRAARSHFISEVCSA